MGMDGWKVNDGRSQIKQPWTGKMWKKGQRDCLANMQLHFWGELEKSSQNDYFDYTCPPVFALLSVLMEEQWFLSTSSAPFPSNSLFFSPLLIFSVLGMQSSNHRVWSRAGGGANNYGKEKRREGVRKKIKKTRRCRCRERSGRGGRTVINQQNEVKNKNSNVKLRSSF